jgi:hypothetical protein
MAPDQFNWRSIASISATLISRTSISCTGRWRRAPDNMNSSGTCGRWSALRIRLARDVIDGAFR